MYMYLYFIGFVIFWTRLFLFALLWLYAVAGNNKLMLEKINHAFQCLQQHMYVHTLYFQENKWIHLYNYGSVCMAILGLN